MVKYILLLARFTVLISTLVCLAVCANAQDNESRFAAAQGIGTSGLIESVVIDVQGTSVTIAGGIVIDISRAVILSIGGGRPLIAIKPGMCIRAVVSGSSDGSSTLIAELVRVHAEDEIIFSGLLQEADLEEGHITLANRRILITGETSMPTGFKQRKLKAGFPVTAIVKVRGSELVATILFPNFVLPVFFP